MGTERAEPPRTAKVSRVGEKQRRMREYWESAAGVEAARLAQADLARHPLLRGTRRLDSNRIVEQTVLACEPDELLKHIDFAALDRDSLARWSDSLASSIRALRTMKTRIDAEMNPTAAAVARSCEICGEDMLGRSDRRYCGAACRQRAKRKRHVS